MDLMGSFPILAMTKGEVLGEGASLPEVFIRKRNLGPESRVTFSALGKWLYTYLVL